MFVLHLVVVFLHVDNKRGHIPYIRPWAYIRVGKGGIINEVIIKLRTASLYKRETYTRGGGGLIYGALRYFKNTKN